MMDDSTLGGYLEVHNRPPAFEGADGAAYSADVFVDEDIDAQGRYGAAILFVCWSADGDRPIGHVETPYLGYGATPEEAGAAVRSLTLHDVKRHLDRAIAARQDGPSW